MPARFEPVRGGGLANIAYLPDEPTNDETSKECSPPTPTAEHGTRIAYRHSLARRKTAPPKPNNQRKIPPDL